MRMLLRVWFSLFDRDRNEIIDTGSSIKRSGSIWVVPNNDHINTRFLLVWDANHMPTGGSASTVSMDAELRVAAERGADILDV